MNFRKSTGDRYKEIIANVLIIQLSYKIGLANQIAFSDFDLADNLKPLAKFFGSTIPYHMTQTQLAYIRFSSDALITLALQCQNILRYHVDADKIYPELMNVKIPKKWDEFTVYAIHDLLEENAKKYHLKKDNIPEDKYFSYNYMDTKLFRVKAMEIGAKNVAFFPNFDSLRRTSIPKGGQVTANDIKDLFGKNVPCILCKDPSLPFRLTERNVIVAF